MQKLIYQLIFMPAFALLSACATSSKIVGDEALLDFLEVGVTQKEAVLKTLGEPTGNFVNESILTYRIGYYRKVGYFLRERPPHTNLPSNWSGVKYSAVLVFDKNNLLKDYSMVEVQ